MPSTLRPNLSSPIHIEYSVRLCNILGVVSPRPKSRFFKMYSIALLTLSLVGYVFSIYGKMNSVIDAPNYYVIKIIESISDFFLSISSTIASIVCLLYSEGLQDIVLTIAKFEKNTTFKILSKHYWISFFITTTSTGLSLFLYMWTWWSYDKVYFKFNLVRCLQSCQETAMLFLWFWIAADVFIRFKNLNQSLERLFEQLRAPAPYVVVDKVNASQMVDLTMKLKKISKRHNYLCDLVNKINRVFGGFLLINVLFATSFMVYKMSVLIFFTVLNSTVNGVSDIGKIRLSFCFLTVHFLLRVLAMAAVGDFMAKEAERTITICYKIINTSCDFKLLLESEGLKEELEHFAHQVNHRKPKISASGFFNVDFTMVGFIVSSITSYIIVAVQFLKDH